jgi:hypothetical protein
MKLEINVINEVLSLVSQNQKNSSYNPSRKKNQNEFLQGTEKLIVNKSSTIDTSNKPKSNYIHSRTARFFFYALAGIMTSSVTGLYPDPQALSQSAYRTSWIGNTFSGGDKWVQNWIGAMYVAPNGTVYTNSVWDEGGREGGIYKDGNVIGSLSQIHGWGRLGGAAITANSNYVYAAMQQGGGYSGDYPPTGTVWYAVRRYSLSGSPAPFAGGRGYDQSMLIVSTSGGVTGLATAGGELYVSDNAANRIRVYDAQTLTELRSWTMARPGQMAVDGQGNLWIIQGKDASNAPKILKYSKTGALSRQITGIVDPTAIAVDNQGRLLVTENGLSQQVLIYNIKNAPVRAGTFGSQGGIYSSNRGEVGNLKFYGLTGVGTDALGNIYVNSDGFGSGTDLRKFSAAGVMQWQLLGTQFVDNADADPATDGVDVFTKQEHFVMDYSKSNGQESTYKGFTVDKFRYPDDPRLHNDNHSTTSVFVRRIAGKRFLFVMGMYGEQFSVYRFDGEIAVPTAIFSSGGNSSWPANQPTTGRWLWRDLNGDGSIQSSEYTQLGGKESIWGWEVDSKGDVWQASETAGVIRRYSIQGLDAYGSPIYGGTAATISMPAPFNLMQRIKYIPETDTMYIGGYTPENPRPSGQWGIVGTEIVRYDNWSTTKNVRWRVKLPYNPSANPILIIKAMDVAGDRIFAVDSRTAQIYVYNTVTGAYLKTLSPGTEVQGQSGWVDIPYGVRVYRRANGEYLVFVEEDAKAKVIMYRLAE